MKDTIWRIVRSMVLATIAYGIWIMAQGALKHYGDMKYLEGMRAAYPGKISVPVEEFGDDLPSTYVAARQIKSLFPEREIHVTFGPREFTFQGGVITLSNEVTTNMIGSTFTLKGPEQ